MDNKNNNNKNNSLNLPLLQIEHRWMVITSLMHGLLAEEALDLQYEEGGQRKADGDVTKMIVGKIDRALTEEFGQPEMTADEIVKMIQGIDIITVVAEARLAR